MLAGLDCPGEQLVSMVEVEIGGQRIDRQYGDWMHIWNQLTLTSEQAAGYNKMIGNTTQLTYLTDSTFADVATACSAAGVPEAVCAPRKALPETTLYVPLQFWFCRNPGLALPLIALQYHEVKINIELRPLDECLYAVSDVAGSPVATTTNPPPVLTANLLSLLLFSSITFSSILMNAAAWHRTPTNISLNSLQFTGDESIGSSSNKDQA